ncbi:mucin-12 [Tachysurus fulvidraco]|uniref:mucin-12 n=1 Tax=Tachysurus fulvidraco TaxID=1234273 RepID=UPI001FEE7E50|nr:mucin-12 [Tachysurus fulvidraco]XP_047676081.1 mucin-12 [Tachysurus fulvidraco]
MDVPRQVQGTPRLHYRLNGYQQPKDDGLQFLSVEEKECILFFEETIDSLEEGFDDTTRLTSRRTAPAENLQTQSHSPLNPAIAANVSPSVMEHDIIDLVHSPSNFTMPDFQNLAVPPEFHYEILPKKDPNESVVPSSTASCNDYEENNHQPPPGSVPTPVVIASKIAEHQGTGGITPSTLLGHRRSLESKREHPVSARNPRLPSKISMTRSTRDTSPHSIATAAVNIQERRSQVFANLPAGSHPLEGGEPSCIRNLPIRSVSFKDTAPERSRIEALSKLGLTGGKTANLTPNYGITGSSNISPISSPNKVNSSANSPNSSPNKVNSSADSPNSSPNKVNSSANSPNSSPNKVNSSANSPISSPNKVNSSANSASNSANKVSVNTQAHISNNIHTSSNIYEPKPKSEVSSNSFNYYGGKGKSAAISPMNKDTAAIVNQERRSSVPPSSAELKQTDFNSYGGKTTILNPTKSVKEESVPSSSTNLSEPAETHFNSYGGRSKVINPLLNTDVPHGVDCTHSHSPTNALTPTTHHSHPTRSRQPSDQTSYHATPKAPTPLQPDPVHQPIVRTRPATLPPPTAPRPHYSSGSVRPRPDLVPPEILSKPAPSFRAQGITVQFSGKGTTGEARRDALRRLGLLKNTH